MNIEELKKKAEAGDAGAQFKLGIEYKAGDNVKPNNKDALYWFTRAAVQGNAEARYRAGIIHVCVLGDTRTGFRFWIEAASQGHEEAQMQLDYYSSDWGLRQLIQDIKENMILDKAAEPKLFAQQNKDDWQINLKTLQNQLQSF